jgi:hypothetical protein
MRWVRFLLWFVLGLGVLWGGYWFVGARALEKATQAWFDSEKAAGRVAENSAISVAGFADRFDLTISNPSLSDPISGWGWQAPFVQILAMTWRPWHVIAALPPTQVIHVPDGQDVTLSSTRLMASVLMQPTPALPLNRAVVEGEGLGLSSSQGWRMGVDKLVLAAESVADQSNTYRLGADIGTLTLPQAYAHLTDLGPAVTALHLDAKVTLSHPLDRRVQNPQLEGVTLTQFHLAWGVVDLTAQGTLNPDAQGLAEGQIDLRLKGWRSLPAAAVALGLVPASNEVSLQRGLEFLAKASPDPEVISLPLKLQNGLMSLGFIPLGPAPALTQRQ